MSGDIFTFDKPEFEKHIPDIYWTPKRNVTKYFTVLFYMACLPLVKGVRDVFGQMPNFNQVQWSKIL